MVPGDAERAGSFGQDPDRYNRARPSYPDELVEDLTQGRALAVLDVGCGTGIAGRQFAEHGCRVLGVEHDIRMAETARQSGLEVEVSTFEEWVPPRDMFDLLICAQAWHWIDPLLGPTKAASVLTPSGQLAIMWIEYRHSDAVDEAFRAVYSNVALQLIGQSYPLGGFPPEHQAQVAAEYATAIRASTAFNEPTVRSYTTARHYSTDEWLDELPTHSDHLLLRSEQRAQLYDRLREALAGMDNQLSVDLVTHLVVARRKPDL